VLGASGMAGHVIASTLSQQGFHVTALAGSRKINDDTVLLDLTQKQQFEEFLQAHQFDAIVNAAGILIAQSETRKDLATYVNSFLPHFLEGKYQLAKTKIIHVSTDCVFSGEHAPYHEHSRYDGTRFYDKTKALGEVINEKDVTFRMSIIGPDTNPDGVGLFNWFQRQRGQVEGYKNYYWNGITTLELAKAIGRAITENVTGLYHLVSPESTSKLDLLRLFKDIFRKDDIDILPKDNPSNDKTLINTRHDFDHVIPNYTTMIQDMKYWIDERRELYSHYRN
jgi:dTDP-4-dehydrorhamnose reductase